MSPELLADAGTQLPPGAPWWAALVVLSIPGIVALAKVFFGRPPRKSAEKPAGPPSEEARGDLAALRAEVAALRGRVAALEQKDHSEDVRLATVLTRLETKIQTMEEDARDGRRSSRA